MSGWGSKRDDHRIPVPPKQKREEAAPFPVPSDRADRAAGYLEHCEVYLATYPEEVRSFLCLAWALGAVDQRLELRRPDRMRLHEVVREAWWLVWTGGTP